MANYQFSLTQVMQATNAILKKLTSASVFGGVTTDTRKIEEGMLFIALKGENFDGNAMYEKAFENGASTCILQGIEIDDNCIEKYKNKKRKKGGAAERLLI